MKPPQRRHPRDMGRAADAPEAAAPDTTRQAGDAVRVAIADPHAVVREGVRAMLAGTADLELVAEADGPDEALMRLDELDRSDAPADVLLIDLPPRADDAHAVARAVAARHPDLRVLTLASEADPEPALAALDAGAAGCVLKEAGTDELVWAVRAVAHGHVVLPARIARGLGRHPLVAPVETQRLEDLTRRERQVLAAVAAGEANKVIARRLELSERTVRTHVSSILRKLGLSSRTQAALLAVRLGATEERDEASQPGVVTR